MAAYRGTASAAKHLPDVTFQDPAPRRRVVAGRTGDARGRGAMGTVPNAAGPITQVPSDRFLTRLLARFEPSIGKRA